MPTDTPFFDASAQEKSPILERPKAIFNWSGGKDSALALHRALLSGEYEIIALLTTLNRDTQRSSMHAIPLALLALQADSIGLALYPVELAPDGAMGGYEQAMREAVDHFRSLGVTHFIFGDICLHDVKRYREEKLTPLGITVVEPLWEMTSQQALDAFVASGLQTVVVVTDASALGAEWVGRSIDAQFSHSLPLGVDPSGENGEYHTFCYAGGMFRHPVAFTLGPTEKTIWSHRLDDGTVREYSYWSGRLSPP